MTQTMETLTPIAVSEVLRLIWNPNAVRSLLCAPWRVTSGEQTWSCATDGRRVLYIEGALPGLEEYSGAQGNLAEMLRLAPLPTHAVDRADLLAAIPDDDEVSAGEIPTDTECPDCYGWGEVECDLGHDHDCPRCEGDGRIGAHALRETTPIAVKGLGCRINAVLLRGILPRLPGDSIQVSERPGGLLCFRGPGWIFLIASLNGAWPDAAIIPSKPIQPELAERPA